MVSAARTIGLRHSAWLSRRMAEIITPAWLMPTQKMKLVMKKPQKMGCLQAGDAKALVHHEAETRSPRRPR